MKLRHICIGAMRYTTREWLTDFFEALTDLDRKRSEPVPVTTPAMTAARLRAARAAGRELERHGI